ncbi:MAG: AraC family transcriptional regulator [Lentilactobacillus hilgardii]|uniref:AraC family transcriptional regulator n=1 Tax=Lentilactobacillus hilgardii TaxID=1588 RepID=UPI001CC1F236|nr:AraC family transcriptional regulator [Lentilactobacillus hilgardii]MBZ2201809.1 AraC family transcriptional regulator [Lentilactobacillus hilgardii]MBZ2204726.1 AraC family transcriptional regulator [Lentilactobacillus hilgardii]
METDYISISCIPLPTFIQGGYAIFDAGETHPNRNDLQYFVLMFMVKGTLFIAEDGHNYTLKQGDVFILLPRHHHYSWKTVEEQTEYYWLHFSVTGKWLQGPTPVEVNSKINIPTLHYFTPSVTLYLKKCQQLTDKDATFKLINRIFKNSALQNNLGFWQAQQQFIDLLQTVQEKIQHESSYTRLAENIERYLRDHFDEKITNTSLGQKFHVHPNSVTLSMKKTFGMTPNAFLTKYRLEEAVKRLLTTSEPINQIATDVGYRNIYYFSSNFKQHYGISPIAYREKFTRK